MADETALGQLLAAATDGDLGLVRRMVESDPSLATAATPTGERAIHAAHYRGHEAIVNFLLDAGEQADLFLEIELGQVERVAARLEDDPALVGARARNGAGPLHDAVYWGYPDIARLLIERGADVNHSTSEGGYTPLASAVAAPTPYCPGDEEAVVLETVDLLLDAGADVDARNAGGTTPLFTAAANGDLSVVQRLVERGADPTVAGAAGTHAGQTALDIANERGHGQVADWLRTRVNR